MIQPEERETTIVYDYAASIVKVFTTQKAVYDNFLKRLGKDNASFYEKNQTYEIVVPINNTRQPYLIAPILNK